MTATIPTPASALGALTQRRILERACASLASGCRPHPPRRAARTVAGRAARGAPRGPERRAPPRATVAGMKVHLADLIIGEALQPGMTLFPRRKKLGDRVVTLLAVAGWTTKHPADRSGPSDETTSTPWPWMSRTTSPMMTAMRMRGRNCRDETLKSGTHVAAGPRGGAETSDFPRR